MEQQEYSFKQSMNPVRNTYSFIIFMQTLNVNLLESYQKETLLLHKHEDIVLNSMTQTREKWDNYALSRPYF